MHPEQPARAVTKPTAPLHRVAAAAALTSALGLTPACASDSGAAAPQPQTAPAPGEPLFQRGTYSVDHDAYAALGYQLVWRGFAVMGERAQVLHFDVFDDTVVVQDTRATVTAMERTSGSNRWSIIVGQPLDRYVGMASLDGRLIVSSDNELIFLDDRTGNIEDKHDLALVVNTRPLVAGGVAVFGAANGRVLGHNLGNGFPLWQYALTGAISADPVAVGPYAAAVSQGGDVIILDPQTGDAAGRASTFGGLTNDPVGGADTLYVASSDQSVYAFSTERGRQIWRRRFEQPITAQPALAGDTLYVEIPGLGLTALNASNGETRWTADGVRGRVIGAREGRVYGYDGRDAWMLDAARGDVLERRALPGLHTLRMIPFEGGDLFAVTPAGAVARFEPR